MLKKRLIVNHSAVSLSFNLCSFFSAELEVRQKKGYIGKDVFLLTVEDPKEGTGSGGATINALLTVAEYISAQRGYSVSLLNRYGGYLMIIK